MNSHRFEDEVAGVLGEIRGEAEAAAARRGAAGGGQELGM
jgi:hypothetical protein